MACDPQIEPNNQWAAEFMKIAFDQATDYEIARRSVINQDLVGGITLSVRAGAVLRDIQRVWLGAMAPAGVA